MELSISKIVKETEREIEVISIYYKEKFWGKFEWIHDTKCSHKIIGINKT